MVNGSSSRFFNSSKGLHQGILCCHYYLVMEALRKLPDRAVDRQYLSDFQVG